jgi:hypothetical protein
MRNRSFPTLALCAFAFALFVSTAGAGLVTWYLNPSNLNQSLGSPSHTYTVAGSSITAYGFSAENSLATLYYKAEPPNTGANETGLGLRDSPFHELNAGAGNFIQFDLTSILSAGFLNGQIAVASLQSGEGYKIFGSNTLGVLGTEIGGPFNGVANDRQFVNIPNFGSFDFISIIASTGNVLPYALQATMPAIPELGGSGLALILLAFFGVVVATRKVRAATLS